MTSRDIFFGAARCLAVAAAIAAALAGCVSPVAPEGRSRVQVEVEVLNAARRFEHVYLLQPGDQIEVFMQRYGDLTRKVTIRPDGFISLPIVNEVKAAGKSPAQLAEELRTLFVQRLREPEVNVIVLNPPEPMVYVVGQVGAPKALSLRQASTLAQAVAQAGDVTRNAAPDSISVVRLNPAGQLESRVLRAYGASQPEVYMAMAAVPLQSNDLVVVPESYRSQIMRTLQDTSVALNPILNVLILREISRKP